MIMDLMQDLRRTCYCGEVTKAGETVVVGGFVQKVRNLGNLIFIDLRDRTGIVQLAFNDQTDRVIFEKAASCHSEYVLLAKGVVAERSSINKDMKTGAVEVLVDDLRVLSKAQTPPFAITDETKTNEELRLKYRYLDLRRAPLQHNLMMRHKIALAAREYFYANNFIEIETPMMMKSTPEGARDYLIPSRVHNGKFYALPQSPQIYKQLLMVAGMDRYIQIARCFRDEDLRADRQPEFTQIDLEMSFVDVEDILQLTEGFVKYLFQKVLHMDITTPLPRMTYQEAMERYGSDKPDTRFGMELHRNAGSCPHRRCQRGTHLCQDRAAHGQARYRRTGYLYLHQQLERLLHAVDHAVQHQQPDHLAGHCKAAGREQHRLRPDHGRCRTGRSADHHHLPHLPEVLHQGHRNGCGQGLKLRQRQEGKNTPRPEQKASEPDTNDYFILNYY